MEIQMPPLYFKAARVEPSAETAHPLHCPPEMFDTFCQPLPKFEETHTPSSVVAMVNWPSPEDPTTFQLGEPESLGAAVRQRLVPLSGDFHISRFSETTNLSRPAEPAIECQSK